MPAELAERGITVLMDQRTQVEVNGDRLSIAGLRFWTVRTAEVAAVLSGAKAPTLLIAHDPRRLRAAAALNVGLVLSGHTHGGQVVLPGLGAVAAYRFPVVAGMAQRDNTLIFVSRGVGTVIVPYRLNCPPDVSVLTLKQRPT
jgi:predicted MPP superfamily phosphohydrolase